MITSLMPRIGDISGNTDLINKILEEYIPSDSESDTEDYLDDEVTETQDEYIPSETEENSEDDEVSEMP
ncbi:hypothetical protein SK128_003355 [Halocaridina rubra]|uniref:Uncharacterized protein n=1 Tax=Halocaridina rubra TaxID=373956 RepID=A0AAN8WHC5_HALRR